MNLQGHRLILTWLAAVAVGCHAVDGAAAPPPAGPAWAWNLAVRFPNRQLLWDGENRQVTNNSGVLLAGVAGATGQLHPQQVTECRASPLPVTLYLVSVGTVTCLITG